jgi:hypothetical protein
MSYGNFFFRSSSLKAEKGATQRPFAKPQRPVRRGYRQKLEDLQGRTAEK